MDDMELELIDVLAMLEANGESSIEQATVALTDGMDGIDLRKVRAKVHDILEEAEQQELVTSRYVSAARRYQLTPKGKQHVQKVFS